MPENLSHFHETNQQYGCEAQQQMAAIYSNFATFCTVDLERTICEVGGFYFPSPFSSILHFCSLHDGYKTFYSQYIWVGTKPIQNFDNLEFLSGEINPSSIPSLWIASKRNPRHPSIIMEHLPDPSLLSDPLQNCGKMLNVQLYTICCIFIDHMTNNIKEMMMMHVFYCLVLLAVYREARNTVRR